MANWKYTIDVNPIWEKYEDVSHEDYDNDPDLFHTMKNEMVEKVKKEIKPGDFAEIKPVIELLEKAKHLSSFNSAWNRLYDWCDYKKVWLKTSF